MVAEGPIFLRGMLNTQRSAVSGLLRGTLGMQQVLEREVDEKTQQLQTMATTLQKFKLELVNRAGKEDTFAEKRAAFFLSDVR